MTWFRLDDDVVNDPKVQSLPPDLFKAWINLLCLASKGSGVLPDAKGIAFGLRVSEQRAEKILSSLRDAGLVDEKDGVSQPHNWNGRQHRGDVSTERVQRFRKRNTKRDETVSETPPEQNRAEQNRKDAAGAATETFHGKPPDPDADLFRRGREVLGKEAGGLVAKVKRAKNGSVPLTRAAIETAATKDNPREYLGRIVSGAAADADPNSPAAWSSGIPGVT
jgi:hypothetical protein